MNYSVPHTICSCLRTELHLPQNTLRYFTKLQLINWVPTRPLTGPFESGGKLAPITYDYISSNGMLSAMNTLLLQWPQLDPGWSSHPWEDESELTQRPPGTARPCYLEAQTTSPFANLGANNGQPHPQELLPVLGTVNQLPFVAFFLTQRLVSGWGKGHCWPKFYLKITSDFIPTNSLFHIRILTQQVKSRG